MRQLTFHKDHLLGAQKMPRLQDVLLQWRKEPTRGLREAALDQHPREAAGQGKAGPWGKAHLFNHIHLKTSHLGQANKQAVQTTSAFITTASITHVFLIFCLCYFLQTLLIPGNAAAGNIRRHLELMKLPLGFMVSAQRALLSTTWAHL